MASSADGVPPALVHHVERAHVLPEKVVLFTSITEHYPVSTPGARTEHEDLGSGIYRVVARVGFMETPDVPLLVAEAVGKGLPIETAKATYFLGRETILAQPGGRMGEWEEGFFAFLTRNSRPATSYFKLPPEQVVEIGTQIDL
jgi:KUP system potassium uptake protein